MCLIRITLAFGFLTAGLSAAPASAWPVSKERAAELVSAPDREKASALRRDADAAFDKKNFADAVALRKLERLVVFLSEHPVSASLRGWMLENREVSEEFITLLSAKDDAKAVARILEELWTKDEAGFRKFPSLAFAIALVYDKAPTPWFPHHQVSEKQLPRALHTPADAFEFFKESAEGARLIQSPAKLGIDELAFVVPVLPPFKELRDVQRRKINRSEIPKLYPSIQYDHGRLKSRVMDWPHGSYSLETIKAKGGICVDQAYYTATVAQALGVPAFILSGAGNGGFHAFTGYLEKPGKWRTDVGRYATQKYATGEAFNPLTWGELTDHDLAFLESRFRSTPAYAAVELQVVRANEHLASGDVEAAAKLLMFAKNSEPRCPELWEALAALYEAKKEVPARRQALYAEAAKALGKFRELEIRWRAKLAESLESEGKSEAALAERISIVRRNAGARPEVACALAGDIMDAVIKGGDRKRVLSVFNKLASQFEDAGPEFYLKVVYPVLADLYEGGLKKEASQVIRSVTQKFKTTDADSQLSEMNQDLSACAAAGTLADSRFMKYVRRS